MAPGRSWSIFFVRRQHTRASSSTVASALLGQKLMAYLSIKGPSGESNWDMLAGAVVLTRTRTSGTLADLTVEGIGDGDLDAARVDDAFGHNPQVGMIDLIDAVQRGAAGALRLDRGKGRGYLAQLRS